VIKWSWRREARTFEPRRMINPKLMELETAKEILEEIFHVRSSDVDDMIQRRLEEKGWSEESWNEESWRDEDGLWPASFGVGE
jgi:hypothetical protein